MLFLRQTRSTLSAYRLLEIERRRFTGFLPDCRFDRVPGRDSRGDEGTLKSNGYLSNGSVYSVVYQREHSLARVFEYAGWL